MPVNPYPNKVGKCTEKQAGSQPSNAGKLPFYPQKCKESTFRKMGGSNTQKRKVN
jgi:hypothetical protein